MPILAKEPDIFPEDLLGDDAASNPWWFLYTRSRAEKKLTRELRDQKIAHYAPVIPHRTKSPAGRVRTSYIPLFVHYVFLCGDEEARHRAVCTGQVLRATPILDCEELVEDLRQIQSLIAQEVPLSVEARIQPGQRVRVRGGSFNGYEGTVVQRTQETHLIVEVRFMNQGVSVKLDDCQMELI
ncbi:MAG: transcription termination/antitermination NusG family protein [Planctomycetota bacterium]